MSKFLSMSWFKNRIENAVEKVITKKIDNLMDQDDEEEEAVYEKPYITAKLVNNVLTVVLNDGSIVSKPGATQEDFDRVRNAQTEAQIVSICIPQDVRDQKLRDEKELNRIKALQNSIQNLGRSSDFTVEGNTVYMKETGRSMPQLMVEKFAEILEDYRDVPDEELMFTLAIDEEYQSLKRFFMWCCLNPRAEVADKLYNFLMKNSFNITKQGFFAALRNVVTLHGGTEFVQFVSNAYNKVKAVWKKSPDKYEVYLKDGQYSFIHIDDTFTIETVEAEEYYDEDLNEFVEYEEEEVEVKRTDLGEYLGNLTELYLDLPNRHENRFTDAHTRTFDIRVGSPVSMDPAACRWNTDDCGAEGLHFTSDEIHYVGCGDQSVLVLINPMKVVGIGESKGRCWEYLPIMTVDREEATTILHDLDFDTLELDEDYAIRELQNLAEKAKEGFSVEMKKHSFDIPKMNSINIETTVASLEQMRNTLSKRVSSID